MLLLGAVLEVQEYVVVFSLPFNMRGTLAISDVSSQVTELVETEAQRLDSSQEDEEVVRIAISFLLFPSLLPLPFPPSLSIPPLTPLLCLPLTASSCSLSPSSLLPSPSHPSYCLPPIASLPPSPSFMYPLSIPSLPSRCRRALMCH